MDTKSKAVLDAALELPEAERAWVAEELLTSLAPEVDGVTDDELAAELDRRLDEARRDPSASIHWSELRDQG